MAGLASNSPAGSLVVGYWSIRGLGAPLRMLVHFHCFHHPELKVECRNHDAGVAGEASYKKRWFHQEKPALLELNPMINLPYLVHTPDEPAGAEAVVVTQTNACLCYLGELFGMLGESSLERARVQQVLCQTMDLRNLAVKQFYSGGDQQKFDEGIKSYVDGVRVHYTKLDGFMAKNSTSFSASDKVTVADFHCWEMLDQNEIFAERILGEQSLLSDFPRLEALHKRMLADPRLAPYFASEHARLPLNNPHGVFR